MALQPGISVSTRGRSPMSTDTRQIQYLRDILQALNAINSTLHTVYTSAPAVFTVGTTAGAPVNGQSTWTISTINVIGKNIVLLKNGAIMTAGTAYTFNDATGVVTLATGTFATSEVYTILY